MDYVKQKPIPENYQYKSPYKQTFNIKLAILYIVIGIVCAVVSVFLFYTSESKHETVDLICSLVCFWTVLFLLPMAMYIEEHKNDIKVLNWSRVVFCAVLSTIIFVLATNSLVVRSLNIHKLFLEPQDSTRCYYVIAENEKGKTYTLPAEVSFIFHEGYRYEVRTVRFKNGGYLDFSNSDAYFKKSNERVYCADQRFRKWYITLTNNYVENNKIDSNENVENSFFGYLITLALIIYGVFSLIKSYKIVFSDYEYIGYDFD